MQHGSQRATTLVIAAAGPAESHLSHSLPLNPGESHLSHLIPQNPTYPT